MTQRQKEDKFKQGLFKAKTEAIILSLVCGARVTLDKSSMNFRIPVKNDRGSVSFDINIADDSLMNQFHEVDKARRAILYSLNCVNPVHFEHFSDAYGYVMQNFVTSDILVERASIKNTLKNLTDMKSYYCSFNSFATYENKQYLMALTEVYSEIEEITKNSHISVQRIDEIISDAYVLQHKLNPLLVRPRLKKSSYDFKVENSHVFSVEEFSVLD